ncbi:MAG: fumarylacetoacetate hydrolase family protein [candidate division WS1 bacterium]|nr:fumarylacetoacetate hydrolase family protein [candidate division WS1 bacterium]
MSVRLVSFISKGSRGAIRAGLLVGDIVVDLVALFEAGRAPRGAGQPMSVIELLECDVCLNWAAELAADLDTVPDDARHSRHAVKLLSPIPNPGKILCMATNYQSHLQESLSRRMLSDDNPTIETPRVFMKPSANTICGDGAPILVTRQSRFVDYEGELAVIIGKRCRQVGIDEAMQYVGGVSCCNDISERRLRVWERPEDKDWDKFFDWLNGKWMDNGFPMGPCVVPTRFISDPHALDLQTRVNGVVKQHASTGEMIFDIAQTIAFISEIMTLEPGDVIATGTPEGVGSSDGTNLKPGDVVEVEISEIGVLTNPVEAEAQP